MRSVVEIKSDYIKLKGKSIVKNDIYSIEKDEKYYYIKYDNNKEKELRYHLQNVDLCENKDTSCDRVLVYLKKVAKELDDNSTLEGVSDYLSKQLDEINVDNSMALKSYINKINKKRGNNFVTIFPFDFNASQIQAIKNGFENQFSIIEGPPGTGKTQSILNIIANMIYQKKRVAVVSPTNEATKNIDEKMMSYEFDFLIALVGNKQKRDDFSKKDITVDINFEEWKIDNKFKLEQIVSKKILKLEKMFELENKKSIFKNELLKWNIELEYFEEFVEKNDTIPKQDVSSIYPWFENHGNLMNLILDLSKRNWQSSSKINRLKLLFKYGIVNFEWLNTSNNDDLIKIEKYYYISKINSLENSITKIDNVLLNCNFEEIKKEVKEMSLKLFKNAIYENGYTFENSKEFSKKIKQFPIVLSTIDAILRCNRGLNLFDYVIIDEASMASTVKSVLPFACTKNAIIVGDQKQLSVIVDNKINKNIECCDESFDYFKHNLISSICAVFNNKLPTTLLNEHYRCLPQIINFCNEQFYDNKLIIKRDSDTKLKSLMLIKTNDGNHMVYQNKSFLNLREVSVIFQEVVESRLVNDGCGIVTPYAGQVKRFSKQMPNKEVNTVHGFQGKECDSIIYSTVIDKKSSKKQQEFVDADRMLNVTISRAKNQFVMVSSVDKLVESMDNHSAFIKYIMYNTKDSYIYQSKINSIFDLLQNDYCNKLNKKIKRYEKIKFGSPAEKLTFGLLEDIIEEFEYNQFTYTHNVRMNRIVKASDLNTDRHIKFIRNNSEADVVIYNKFNKKPLGIIETDGFTYHDGKPEQEERDQVKNDICDIVGIEWIRLSTKGDSERNKIIEFLDKLKKIDAVL